MTPAPLTAGDLAEHRYREITRVVAAQCSSLADFSRWLAEWQVRLDTLAAENAALRERVASLENIIRDWSQPLSAEEALEAAQETADAAARDTGTLTDVIVLALRRLGIAVDPDSTVDEVKEFLEGGSE